MNCFVKKGWLVVLVLLCLVLAPAGNVLAASSSGATPIAVLVDGSELVMDVPPYVQDSNLMLPVRAVFEALGATVDNPPGTGIITGVKGDTTVQMEIGLPDAAINGHTYGLPVPVQVLNNRTLAPVRFVAEALNCYVSWDQAKQTALILSGEKDWEGYPSTVDAVMAEFLIAHGRSDQTATNKYLYKPKEDFSSWPTEPMYSWLKIISFEECGASNEMAFSTAQDISAQTGLPCKAYMGEWYEELTPYGEALPYSRGEGDQIGWFYMVQLDDGSWKSYGGFSSGP